MLLHCFIQDERKVNNIDFGIMMTPGLVVSCIAFFFVQHLRSKLQKERVGADLYKSLKIGGKIDGLALQIKDGARAFLVEEYKVRHVDIFRKETRMWTKLSVVKNAPSQ